MAREHHFKQPISRLCYPSWRWLSSWHVGLSSAVTIVFSVRFQSCKDRHVWVLVNCEDFWILWLKSVVTNNNFCFWLQIYMFYIHRTKTVHCVSAQVFSLWLHFIHWVCAFGCYDKYVEVRGKPQGVHSVPPLYVPGLELKLLTLAVAIFAYWAILPICKES